MSKYYTPHRTRNMYDPRLSEPFRISRTKIDLYLNCPLCFYLDRRRGVGQPPSFPFTLNSAVDTLLKKEFDSYRARAEAHPLMKAAGIEAVPFNHPQMDLWRDSLRGGITYAYPGTNLLLTGGVDDLWQNRQKELMVVDYKSTSKTEGVGIDADWQIGYRCQMEIYQWLFRKNAFKVSATGYFVYCNGLTDRDALNNRLDFEISIIPYKGDDAWVDAAIKGLYACLQSDSIPPSGADCPFCQYREAVGKVEN
ncbi:MAG: PD-(D/E)XK nuclease family protein [Candidatus Omnitrophica bacterium]|nr:PD-(D/E)XK nuclease family protein [Candidatus Omnitrophota bacterium]